MARASTKCHLIVRAAREVPIAAGILGIADLGAAQGKNSLQPMHAAIAELRARTAKPIAITHTDIPSNDFTSLFELLANSRASYLRGQEDVYAFAAGVSFYERVFAAQTQTIGWNSIAVHWLSSPPCSIPNHIWSPYAQGDVRRQFRERAAQDWLNFLSARSVEFLPGGQIALVASCADDRGFAGAEGLMNVANDELQAMVRNGTIPEQQYRQMLVPTYYRTYTIRCGSLTRARTTRQRSLGPIRRFCARSSEPCLFGEAASAVADRFYDGVCERIERDPAGAVCRWQLLLMRIRRCG